MMNNQRIRRSSVWTILVIGLMIQVHQASAILNCFSPKMFNKLGKGGQQVPYPAGGPERANWYPQQPYNPYPVNHYGLQYQYPSMKPGLGYGYSAGGGSLFGPMAYPQPGNYAGSYGGPNHHHHQQGDMLVSHTPAGYSPLLNTYSTPAGANINDGWTIPSQHQVNPLTYDSGYTQQVIRQPSIDPYGSVKGANTRHPPGATKKGNILLADGGYSAHDAHLASDPFSSAYTNRSSFGYSYPESYSGVVESPAKIAQQLMRYGLRQQRLQQQQTFARLAPLLLAPNGSVSEIRLSQGDEPRFVGFGVIDALNNREARLSCSFNEPINQLSPNWIKFLGPYNSTQMSGANIVPPFNCPTLNCRIQEIETNKDPRYRIDIGPATSTLIISEPRSSDYGVYRCSALSKVSPSPATSGAIYKIVQLGETTI